MSRRLWVLTVALVAGSAACREQQSQASDTPRVFVAAPRHDFGTMVQEQELQHEFVLENRGGRLLELHSVEPGRDCRGEVVLGSVTPGQSGRVRISCRPALYGPFRETLTVRSNDPLTPRLPLELAGDVTPLLAFERDQVDFDVPCGATRREVVRLIGARANDARLSVSDRGPCELEVAVLPPGADRAAGLELRFTARSAGVRVGQVMVATGLERPSELGLRYTCKVPSTLEVSPTNPYFNLSDPEHATRLIEVRSSQPGFRVHSVTVTDGPFQASLEPPNASGRQRVKVTLRTSEISDTARGVNGKLLIRSNDVTEPTKEVPLFGMGTPARAGSGSH